jgi:hypothetical protein
MTPRFQFSVRALLGATTWLAIAGGAFSELRHGTLVPERYWPFLMATFVISPCLAVGTLVGRKIMGLLIGLLVFAVLWDLMPRVQ